MPDRLKLFVEKSIKVHGNKYDYSKVKYINSQTKVCIICPEHGEFWQTPASHVRGYNCPKCANKKRGDTFRKTSNHFINQAKNIHGNKYDYSKVNYINSSTKVCVICPEHGEFNILPQNHLLGQGCPKCAGKHLSTKEIINKFKNVHGNKYDYSKVEYSKMHEKVLIICPEHGEFWQTPSKHISGQGCPKCANKISKSEDEIYNILKSNLDNVTILRRNRNLLSNKELDILIPDKNIAIEYNGILWHSEKYKKDKNYHLNKLKECNLKGIKLIQIFEDEWNENKNLVIDKIKHILGIKKFKGKIYARKCIIKEICRNDAKEFLNLNHIQGAAKSTLYLGCYFNDLLIGVMSFRKNSDEWELTRFASHKDYLCNGCAGKLLSYFIKHYNPTEIKSFADRRWTISKDNNLYVKLGFKLDKILKPDYRYVVNGKRMHKFNFRKKILHKKYGLPMTMTEKEMIDALGVYRIWDCGLFKYSWKKNKTY